MEGRKIIDKGKKIKVFKFSSSVKINGILMSLCGGGIGILFLVFSLKIKNLNIMVNLIVSLSSLIFVITGIILFLKYSIKVILTEKEIICKEINKEKKILYNEIEKIEILNSSIIVKDKNNQISISRQINNFDKLYNILQQYKPLPLSKFPLKIKARTSNMIGYAILSLFLVILAFFIFRSSVWQKSNKVIITGFIIILLASSFFLLYFFVLKQPLLYIFDEKKITTKNLFCNTCFDVNIKDIHLKKIVSQRWGVNIFSYILLIEFLNGKTLIIDSRNILYSLENLFNFLEHYYLKRNKGILKNADSERS
ncbi:MAG TPA: hypothetical protein PLE45_12210 [Spirochaetota bacterium]|nr:hypothetical protein [Spirochaetota bacterium]HPP05486.1 hypothetical protein [Spirochaetota bacterium]